MPKLENKLVIYTPSVAAGTSRGGQFRRPRDICVVECPADKTPNRSSKHTRVLWVRKNLDSRYTGPNSAYGQALNLATKWLSEVLEGDLTSSVRRNQLKHSAQHLFNMDLNAPAKIIADRYEEAGMDDEAEDMRAVGD